MTENEKEIKVAIEHLKARNMSAKHIDIAIQALEIVAKMFEHCEGSCTDCPYHNQHMDKCMNDLLKGV